MFEEVEAYSLSNRVLTGGAEPLNVTLLQISPGLMEMLGVAPHIGRMLGEDDARGATGPVVVLSHRLWREQFGIATISR